MHERAIGRGPEGVHAFLRAYHHVKSADWTGDRPHRLDAWNVEGLSMLPTYEVMNTHEGMAATVRPHHPSAIAIGANAWLPDGNVPMAFIAGRADWGIYRKPGDFEAMQTPAVAPKVRGADSLDGAGHWVPQEQPEQTAAVLRAFLSALG